MLKHSIVHFAYPNVKTSQGQFIGCGRYVALLPEEVPEGQGYELAASKVTGVTPEYYTAAALLAENRPQLNEKSTKKRMRLMKNILAIHEIWPMYSP